MIGLRGLLLAAAAVCLAAALVVGVTAARLPVPKPQTTDPATLRSPPSSPTITPAGSAVRSPVRARVPEALAESEVVAREQELFDRAAALRESGKLKDAEVLYLLLLRKGRRRDEAAAKLGDMYMRAGSYAKAREMFDESARLLREKPD